MNGRSLQDCSQIDNASFHDAFESQVSCNVLTVQLSERSFGNDAAEALRREKSAHPRSAIGRRLAHALQHRAPALVARLHAASSRRIATAVFATRPGFAGHTNHSAKTNH